jgi:hypothetical protein
VKLSAPPPPPPSPEEPEPTPSGPVEAAAAPPDDTPALASQTALAWPSWFAGADFFLAALAVVLAFLVASFVARNTELWIHLAAGQRLLSGTYTPGTDPFSYSAADRAWVNHNLLYDVAAYLLFRADSSGAALVAAKALVVALAFGLLIALRRPGHSLWPWAAVAVVAIVAAAPRMVLSPIVGSVLFLAITLFLLFRMPHRADSWRVPVAIGITFWLWAMIDSWFFIGPLVLLLVILGDFVQRALGSPAEAEPPAPALGPHPDVPTLVKALGFGLVACMLNPHHVRTWELPFELIGAEGATADSRLKQVLISPLSAEYSKSDQLGRVMGYNFNGLAYAALFVGGGLALGLGAGRLRFAHLALWVGFGLLSLTSIYAIPFFAVVAVPVIASQLNQAVMGMKLKSWGDPKTRFILVGSAAGRVLCVIATLMICVLAWPGWVHPSGGDPSFARRVAWGLYRDDGLVRGAEQLEEWRKSGALAPDARGVITSVELANYCAWFAPSEKVFFNSRYNHHRRELPDYIAFRKGLGIIHSDEDLDSAALDQLIPKYNAEYVAVSSVPGEIRRHVVQMASMLMWYDSYRWSPWYLNGRTRISGWRKQPGQERPSFSALRIDPLALAFGPSAERIEAVSVSPIPPVMGWEQEFVRGINISPAGADEAIEWWRYGQVRAEQLEFQMRVVQLPLFIADRISGGAGAVFLAMREPVNSIFLSQPASEELAAVSYLALRAARRAIAADPDHPDGYFALAQALNIRSLQMSDEERVTARATALRQSLMRMPPPERYRRGAYFASASGIAQQLAQIYLDAVPAARRSIGLGMPANLPAFGPLQDYTTVLAQTDKGMQRVPLPRVPKGYPIAAGPFLLPLDTAREILLLAEKYVSLDFDNEEDRKRETEGLQAWLKVVEAAHREANNGYERERERARTRGQMKLKDKFDTALRYGLVEEALRLVKDRETDLSRELGEAVLEVALIRVALELITGRLEEAASDLEVLPASFDEAEASNRPQLVQMVRALRNTLRMQTFLKLYLEGNYAEAGLLLEQVQGQILKSGAEMAPPSKVVPVLGVLAVSSAGPSWEAAIRFLALVHAQRAGIIRRQDNDSQFFYRRGLLSLNEGDVAGARRRFEQAKIAAIPEWDLPELRNRDAERLLRLIRRAEKSRN